MPVAAPVQLSVKQPLAEAYMDEAYNVVAVPLSGGRVCVVWNGRTDSYPLASTDEYAYLGCRVTNSDGTLGTHVLAWKSPYTGTFSGSTDYAGYDANYGLAASSDGGARVLVVFPIYRYSGPGLAGPIVEYNLLVLLDCSTSTPVVLDTVYDTYRAGSPCTCISAGRTNTFLLLHDDGAVVVDTSAGTISLGAVQQNPFGAAGKYGEFMNGWCDGSVGVIKFNCNSTTTSTYDYAMMFPFTLSGSTITWGTPISGGDVKNDGSGAWVYYYPGGCDMAHDGHDFVMVGGVVADVYPSRAIKLTTDGSTISFVALMTPPEPLTRWLDNGWSGSQTRYYRVVATGAGAFTVLLSTGNVPGALVAITDPFGAPSSVAYTNTLNAGSETTLESLDAVAVGGRIFLAMEGYSSADPQNDEVVWGGYLSTELSNLTGASGPGAVHFW